MFFLLRQFRNKKPKQNQINFTEDIKSYPGARTYISEIASFKVGKPIFSTR